MVACAPPLHPSIELPRRSGRASPRLLVAIALLLFVGITAPVPSVGAPAQAEAATVDALKPLRQMIAENRCQEASAVAVDAWGELELRLRGAAGKAATAAAWRSLAREAGRSLEVDGSCDAIRLVHLPLLDHAAASGSTEPGAADVHDSLRSALLSTGACHLDTPYGSTWALPFRPRAAVLWVPGTQAPAAPVLIWLLGGPSSQLTTDARQFRLVKVTSSGTADGQMTVQVGSDLVYARAEASCSW